MAILIRFCPFPFAYSNLFFASLVDAVSLGHFLAATALITPKLLLHVWIGTRMFVLMDREQRAHLDGWAKALNVLYIIIGSAVGAATGWIVWSETKRCCMQSSRKHRGAGGTSAAFPPRAQFSTDAVPRQIASPKRGRGWHTFCPRRIEAVPSRILTLTRSVAACLRATVQARTSKASFRANLCTLYKSHSFPSHLRLHWTQRAVYCTSMGPH